MLERHRGMALSYCELKFILSCTDHLNLERKLLIEKDSQTGKDDLALLNLRLLADISIKLGYILDEIER